MTEYQNLRVSLNYAHTLVCRYCILPLFPKSYCSVSLSSQGYTAPLFCSDTAQPFWACRAPLSCLPPLCLQLMFDPQALLDSPSFSLPLSFPGSRATGATSTSIPLVLLAPFSILLFAWQASGLCSFLDISYRCCPWEMHNHHCRYP